MTINTAYVYGRFRGVFALNRGSGELSITATQPVVARSGDAVFGRDYRGAVTIATQAVTTGYGAGVSASAYRGPLTITATGTISARGTSDRYAGVGYGVTAGSDGGATTITTEAVYGQQIGIDASHAIGPGDLSITANQRVVSNQGPAIQARTFLSGGALSIATQDVTSEHGAGIVAYNNGAGPLTITANGKISAGGGMGVYAISNNGATITTGSVYGQQAGISAKNTGPRNLSITATGPVTGAPRSGNSANNGGSGGSSGSSGAGITVSLGGSGTGVLTNTGTIAGLAAIAPAASNIRASALSSTVSSSATVAGIYAYNSGAGLTINAGSVTGGPTGFMPGTGAAAICRS
jgi:hypothetical protein